MRYTDQVQMRRATVFFFTTPMREKTTSTEQRLPAGRRCGGKQALP